MCIRDRIICAVCITEKSFVSVVRSGGDKAYHYAREDMERRRENHARRQEERRQEREEQMVRGVNLEATRLTAVSYTHLVKLRAIVTTDNLNIRKEPALDPNNVIGQALLNERYVVLGQQDGWIQIEEGYISADYAEVKYALNEGQMCIRDSRATARF